MIAVENVVLAYWMSNLNLQILYCRVATIQLSGYGICVLVEGKLRSYRYKIRRFNFHFLIGYILRISIVYTLEIDI